MEVRISKSVSIRLKIKRVGSEGREVAYFRVCDMERVGVVV